MHIFALRRHERIIGSPKVIVTLGGSVLHLSPRGHTLLTVHAAAGTLWNKIMNKTKYFRLCLSYKVCCESLEEALGQIRESLEP